MLSVGRSVCQYVCLSVSLSVCPICELWVVVLEIALCIGVILWVCVGHPIVNSRDLWHSCAKVREPIRLPFGVVSGVGPVMVY